MTSASRETAQDDEPQRGDAASPDLVERELAVEQAHVDLVYRRLAEATRTAQQVASAGRSLYQSDRGSYVREEDGTGLYERDVFAYQAAKRLAVLDAEHEGLVRRSPAAGPESTNQTMHGVRGQGPRQDGRGRAVAGR